MSEHEHIDILDEDGHVLGTVSRLQAEAENHITENVLIFLFDSLARVWTQMRPMSKKHYPGLWDISACGGVLSGESRDDAAARETSEETSLDVPLRYVESFLNVFKGEDGIERKRLSHLYVGHTDDEPLPNDEVDEFRRWEISELQSAVTADPGRFIPSFAIELKKALRAR